MTRSFGIAYFRSGREFGPGLVKDAFRAVEAQGFALDGQIGRLKPEDPAWPEGTPPTIREVSALDEALRRARSWTGIEFWLADGRDWLRLVVEKDPSAGDPRVRLIEHRDRYRRQCEDPAEAQRWFRLIYSVYSAVQARSCLVADAYPEEEAGPFATLLIAPAQRLALLPAALREQGKTQCGPGGQVLWTRLPLSRLSPAWQP